LVFLCFSYPLVSTPVLFWVFFLHPSASHDPNTFGSRVTFILLGTVIKEMNRNVLARMPQPIIRTSERDVHEVL
jgi:hypothetical protein